MQRTGSMRIACWVFSVVTLFAAGCSGNTPAVPTWPVEGRVLFDGKPPVGAQVVFHSAASNGAASIHPMGQVDSEGKFTLTTFAANDGAPEGDYDVTVVWWVAKNDRAAQNRLPARYQQPARSGLRAKVTAGASNALPTFKLAR